MCAAALFTLALTAGCGGVSSPQTEAGSDASVPPSQDAATGGHDSAVASPDASHPQPDSGQTPPPESDAGPPQRNSACTPLSQQTGTLVNTSHGRLDGTLVYVIPVGGPSSCNGDDSHVHLQVQVSGSIYDVAVDIGTTSTANNEVGWYEQTIALPDGTWSEGWHGSDSLGYKTLGLSSSEFTTLSPSAMGAQVEQLLANTSKISIFCTGYTPGDNGCHDVHYKNDTSTDGALVLDPTAAVSPIVYFKFQSDNF